MMSLRNIASNKIMMQLLRLSSQERLHIPTASPAYSISLVINASSIWIQKLCGFHLSTAEINSLSREMLCSTVRLRQHWVFICALRSLVYFPHCAHLPQLGLLIWGVFFFFFLIVPTTVEPERSRHLFTCTFFLLVTKGTQKKWVAMLQAILYQRETATLR